jgi:hypothetical protein
MGCGSWRNVRTAFLFLHNLERKDTVSKSTLMRNQREVLGVYVQSTSDRRMLDYGFGVDLVARCVRHVDD